MYFLYQLFFCLITPATIYKIRYAAEQNFSTRKSGYIVGEFYPFRWPAFRLSISREERCHLGALDIVNIACVSLFFPIVPHATCNVFSTVQIRNDPVKLENTRVMFFTLDVIEMSYRVRKEQKKFLEFLQIILLQFSSTFLAQTDTIIKCHNKKLRN